MYSTYEDECEAAPTDKKKIMVLGGGPNRIGQGIEFDYCCVHAALAMREDGYETIMVNCNPETVSTDYDTSDRLYFEPLTLEDVLEIVDKEKPTGVIVQYGGQTPLKLALDLEANGVPIIGTSPDMIDAAEDRERFQKLLHELQLRQPPNATARTEAGGAGEGRRAGLSAGGAPELRARRPRDGNRARAARPRALHARGRQGQQRFAGAARPLPERRDRMRRRLPARCRRRHPDRRRDGAHRAGRRAFGRLRLLAAALQPEGRHRRRTQAPERRDGQGAQRGRPDERAVRDPGEGRPGRHLRARSEPARLAHRALREQGHRHPAGQGRGALHGRPVAGVAGRHARK